MPLDGLPHLGERGGVLGACDGDPVDPDPFPVLLKVRAGHAAHPCTAGGDRRHRERAGRSLAVRPDHEHPAQSALRMIQRLQQPGNVRPPLLVERLPYMPVQLLEDVHAVLVVHSAMLPGRRP